MIPSLETIHLLVVMSVATLFIFQSIILFVRGAHNRVRQTMAVIELLLGLGYVAELVLITMLNLPDEFTLLRTKLLGLGSFYIALIVLFPVQVFLPGWLNWKRGLMLFAPVILMLFFFYAGTYALGETPEYLISYTQVRSSIGHFNVWFRFVLLFVDIVYLGFLLRWIYAHEQRYIHWKNENFADQEYVDVSWMRQYAYILAGIFVFCLLNLFIGGRVIVMFHCAFAALGFSYLF